MPVTVTIRTQVTREGLTDSSAAIEGTVLGQRVSERLTAHEGERETAFYARISAALNDCAKTAAISAALDAIFTKVGGSKEIAFTEGQDDILPLTLLVTRVDEAWQNRRYSITIEQGTEA